MITIHTQPIGDKVLLPNDELNTLIKTGTAETGN